MRFLLLNQTFHPDVVATAQYLSDLAVELARRGHEVIVVTGRRAYDDPRRKFAARGDWRGVRICRVGSTSFGKGAKWRRAADFASFLVCCCWRLLWLPRPDVVLALTSPPLISFIAAGCSAVRRCPFVYWVMDLNPDEAVAAGWLRERSLVARTLDWMSRVSLRRARKIIALDRFMAQRIRNKGIEPGKIVEIPPWSHDHAVRFDAAGREAFRRKHGLDGKFVVMYSGNHSPCHPLDTVMEAARELSGDSRFAFLFVGGGSEQARVRRFAETNGLRNIVCLPYQPLSELSGSLSAADLHLVVMGDPFVGIIHPSKIYNILTVGAPFLYLGPQPSHVTDLLAALPASVSSAMPGRVGYGDVAGTVRSIREAEAAKAGPETGRFAALAAGFAQERLLGELSGCLENAAAKR